jgi:hypothetical protein
MHDIIHKKRGMHKCGIHLSLRNYVDTLNLDTHMIFDAKGRKPMFNGATKRNNGFELATPEEGKKR